MARSTRNNAGGRFEVSGPGHPPTLAHDVRQGCSLAQGWACEFLGTKDDERAYYVTAVGGDPQARITLESDGTVKTVLL